jgi:hypothetical protein
LHPFYVAGMLHDAPLHERHGRSKPGRAQIAKED